MDRNDYASRRDDLGEMIAMTDERSFVAVFQ